MDRTQAALPPRTGGNTGHNDLTSPQNLLLKAASWVITTEGKLILGATFIGLQALYDPTGVGVSLTTSTLIGTLLPEQFFSRSLERFPGPLVGVIVIAAWAIDCVSYLRQDLSISELSVLLALPATILINELLTPLLQPPRHS